MTAALIAAYVLVALVFGYVSARSFYNDPSSREFYHNGGSCFVVLVVFGAVWPLVLLLIVLFIGGEAVANFLGHHNVGRKLFGGKS